MVSLVVVSHTSFPDPQAGSKSDLDSLQTGTCLLSIHAFCSTRAHGKADKSLELPGDIRQSRDAS